MFARSSLVLVLLMVSACPVGVFAQEGGGKVAPSPLMMPDPDWSPQEGQRAEMIRDGVPALGDLGRFFGYMRRVEGQPARHTSAARIARGTKVLILPMPSRFYSGSAIEQALEPGPGRDDPLSVRILDGPLEGRSVVVPRGSVGIMRVVSASPPAPIPVPRKSKPRPISPETRAATMLRSARNLEAAGKVPGAIRIYGDVSRDFPGTIQASEARAKIEALGGR
jgi:hypothetical protein